MPCSSFLKLYLVTINWKINSFPLTRFLCSRHPWDHIRVAQLGDQKITVAQSRGIIHDNKQFRQTRLQLSRAWPLMQFSSFNIGDEQDFRFDDIVADHCFPLLSRVRSNEYSQVHLKSHQVRVSCPLSKVWWPSIRYDSRIVQSAIRICYWETQTTLSCIGIQYKSYTRVSTKPNFLQGVDLLQCSERERWIPASWLLCSKQNTRQTTSSFLATFSFNYQLNSWI